MQFPHTSKMLNADGIDNFQQQLIQRAANFISSKFEDSFCFDAYCTRDNLLTNEFRTKVFEPLKASLDEVLDACQTHGLETNRFICYQLEQYLLNLQDPKTIEFFDEAVRTQEYCIQMQLIFQPIETETLVTGACTIHLAIDCEFQQYIVEQKTFYLLEITVQQGEEDA